jgi:hypothetical protein
MSDRSTMKNTPTPQADRGASAGRLGRWLRSRWKADPAASGDPVRVWKDAWVAGMEAHWSGSQPSVNPHPSQSPAANAWAAGWRWAAHQPDRRAKTGERLAHPHRRRADKRLLPIGSVSATTVGISTIVMAGWLWKMRRKRRLTDDGE